jgi:hypothetical protein
MTRLLAFCLASILFFAGGAEAAVINVVSSGGFAAAYRVLAPDFEPWSATPLAI